MVSAIVACDRANGIGKNGGIPFKSDLDFFKATTTGGVVIMGRKTWESLKVQPLPDRINIVVSRTYDEGRWSKKKGGQTFNVLPTLSLAVQLAQAEYGNRECFLIGGAAIYKEGFDRNLIDKLYLTKWSETYDCDTFFPMTPRDLSNYFTNNKKIEVIPEMMKVLFWRGTH